MSLFGRMARDLADARSLMGRVGSITLPGLNLTRVCGGMYVSVYVRVK